MQGKRSLRVLHVITSLARGGAQAHLFHLARGQRRAGHAVDVAFFKDPVLVPEFGASLCLGEARAAADGRGHRPPPGESGRLIDLEARATLSPGLLRRLVRLIRAGRYEVVHTHLLKADVYGALAVRLAYPFARPRQVSDTAADAQGPIALSASQNRGRRGRPALVASKHNDEQVLRGSLVGRLHGLISRLDDRVIAISDHVLRYMATTGRVPADRLRRIYYGLELGEDGYRPNPNSQTLCSVREEFVLPPLGPLLLSVGRLDPQKGHADLLVAMREVLAAQPDARLLVVGESQVAPSEYRKQLLALAARPELAGRVVIAGERRDVPRLLAACDVFVMASHWEGFGLVFLEAMAAGKPVVATRVSAVPEVVADGETGLLVPMGEPAAMAAALLRLCRDPELAGRLGQAGRARVRDRFAAQRMVEDTLAAYTGILDG